MENRMKAFMISKYGHSPLESREIAVPKVGDEDVLVEIHAASVNPVDFKIRDGKLRLLLHYKMPLILGQDFSGLVKQVGKKVTKFIEGDEVYGRPRKSRIGTFAEYISINEADLSLKPRNLSFEEAASIPLVGLTTYQALHDIIHLKPNQKILIQAGAGGIGTFAIQMAKEMGAFVATTASDAGNELVQQLGADRIINYKKEKFEEVLKGYDAVFDTLGNEALYQSFKILKKGGQLVSISGIPNYRFGLENQMGFLKRNLFRVASCKISKLEKQYQVRYSFLFMKPSDEQLAEIKKLIESGKIIPIVDRIFSFEKVQEALTYSESGRAKGKIIVKMK